MLFAAFIHPAVADTSYPSKPVRVIVPFAAGGTFDLVARIVSQRLTDLWGQQVIVDNRPGGATIIATDMTSKASPDGYTILLSPNALAANPALHKKLPYNTKRDLKPVVLIAAQPMALGANPSFQANSIKDLLEMAKAQPGTLSYGTAGIGSGGYLAGEIFKSVAGVDITHISYKGGNVAMMDVVANQIPLVMTGLPNLLPLQRAGRIKILGITSFKRSPVAEQIPAISETVQGYEFKNWFGFIVPAGTPKALIQKINADVNKVLDTGDTRQKLIDQGFDVLGGTTAEFENIIETDTQKFAGIIRRSGIEAH
ncbi:MAG TPA: tripartite tricarboxylate transporter substrate binding protein [Burkholderiales bacterium]|nr:tripartite tricarboxylate transporter substrate binding protein [Burkholderiales bacterium]